MPGIEDLLAVAGQGGAAAEPTAGASGAAGPSGGMLAQVIGQLMQSPAAMKGMQNFMAGQPPTAGMPAIGPSGQGMLMPGNDPRAGMAARGAVDRSGAMLPSPLPMAARSAGRGPATDSDLYETAEANQSVRGNLPILADIGGYTGYGEEMTPMEDIRQTPMPEQEKSEADEQEEAGDYVNRESADTQEREGGYAYRPGGGDEPPVRGGDLAEEMAADQIDKAGGYFEGKGIPTANDIKLLMKQPTDSIVEAFDDRFGDGAAAEFMNKYGPEDFDEEGDEPHEDSAQDPDYYRGWRAGSSPPGPGRRR